MYEIPAVLPGGVKDLAVFLARLLETMRWHDEAMGYEPPEPVWDVNDVVVEFFFVYGGHDLANFGIYGGMVALPPVQECVIVCSRHIEVARAPGHHDAGVVLHE